ncbi:hypothetical protein C0993_005581 [Termitomyces sp. T159_Od127]|nr:hypothetical protein C0993_005581 [Termitomyces sp. T159_Od127]
MSAPSDLDASFVLVDSPSGKVHGLAVPEVHPSLKASYRPGTASGTYAHDWSAEGTGASLQIQGRHFIDAYGRVCLLRGVNLAGCTKAPSNDNHDTFPAGADAVSFVGRPFPLEEAPEHFARLRRWGLTFTFVSIHQDVWSRYSGGSGAPAWTLELAGFDLDALEETGAAWLLGVKGGGHEESERGVWPTGYTKLAAATMA